MDNETIVEYAISCLGHVMNTPEWRYKSEVLPIEFVNAIKKVYDSPRIEVVCKAIMTVDKIILKNGVGAYGFVKYY